MNRREFAAGVGAFSAALAGGPAPVHSRNLPVVGYLDYGTQSSDLDGLVGAWKAGLREIGYIEAQNFNVEYRWGDNRTDLLNDLTKGLVDAKVNAICAVGNAAVVAAANATKTIPVVFMAGFDPVKAGIVDSLNRPGGNLTGVTISSATVSAKRLQMLLEINPKADAVAVLIYSANPTGQSIIDDLEVATKSLSVRLIALKVKDHSDIELALADAKRAGAGGLIVTAGRFFDEHRELIIRLAAQYSLPSSYSGRSYVRAGGLMSYAEDRLDLAKQAGRYVGRILKGESPNTLPILLPTKFELAVNLRTAKDLGLTATPALLANAEEVIE